MKKPRSISFDAPARASRGFSLGNLTIKTRLIALTSLMAVVVILMAVVSFLSFSSIDSANRGTTQASAQLTDAHDAYEGWLTQDDQSNMAAALALETHNSHSALFNTTWQQVLAGEAQAKKALGNILNHPSTPQIIAAVGKLRADFTPYDNFTKQVGSELRAGKFDAATKIMTVTNANASNAVQADFNKVEPLIEASFRNHANAITSAVSSGKTLLLVIAIVALLLAIGLSFLIVRSITSPLAKLTAAAKRFALGDVKIELDDSGRDEIATVASSFREAIDNQKQLAASFGEFANGRLGVQVEPRSDVDVLSHAFITMQGKISRMISEISQSSETLSSASNEMAATSEETGRAIQEIASAVNNVAAGAEVQVRSVEDARRVSSELADATRTSAETAEETAAAAEEARALARDGVSAAEQASQAMVAVRDASVETTAAIKTLGQKSGEIGGIVETITGIAAQTNLLALNAAIEAARAGEHGRGFAVVAEEVRHLAEESQQAAASISDLIEEIQRETDRTVRVVEAGAAQTEGGVETVEQARDAFMRIGQSVEDMSSRVEQIAASIRQIAASGDQMQETMSAVAEVAVSSSASSEEVSASTEQSSASTQEIAASAQQLASTAEELERLVGQFVLS